eukprot:scaffold433111_cov47-Prasinocladus_malaysianus.AAC.1
MAVRVIQANYNRIRDVETELKDLQLQLKITSGPKKSVLELLRKKIEVQNGKVVAERQKVAKARQVLEEAEASLQKEEDIKDRLCQELNLVVQESAHAQLSKLEQLTSRLEHLHVGIDPQRLPVAGLQQPVATAPETKPNTAKNIAAADDPATSSKQQGAVQEASGQQAQSSSQQVDENSVYVPFSSSNSVCAMSGAMSRST